MHVLFFFKFMKPFFQFDIIIKLWPLLTQSQNKLRWNHIKKRHFLAEWVFADSDNSAFMLIQDNFRLKQNIFIILCLICSAK